jgi:hypothetical protein
VKQAASYTPRWATARTSRPSELFYQVTLRGMSWAVGNIDAETKPNLTEACPGVENVRAG